MTKVDAVRLLDDRAVLTEVRTELRRRRESIILARAARARVASGMTIEDVMVLIPLHEVDPAGDPVMESGFKRYAEAVVRGDRKRVHEIAGTLAGVELLRDEAEAAAPWN